MTAFDTAWDLAKMPIIPGSIREIDDYRMEAQFHDPETNEIYPMMSEIGPYGLETNIKDGKKRAAHSHISEHYGDDWMTSHANTQPHYGQNTWNCRMREMRGVLLTLSFKMIIED